MNGDLVRMDGGARLSLRGLACLQPLYETEPQSFMPVWHEADVDREGHRSSVEGPAPLRVVEQQQPTLRTKNPVHLGKNRSAIAKLAHGESADHRIEAARWERQLCGVPLQQRHLVQDIRPSASHREHFLVEVERGQGNMVGIVAQIEASAHGDLQHAACRSGADPLPAVPEDQPLGWHPGAHIAPTMPTSRRAPARAFRTLFSAYPLLATPPTGQHWSCRLRLERLRRERGCRMLPHVVCQRQQCHESGDTLHVELDRGQRDEARQGHDD